jgi:hypothetical protein
MGGELLNALDGYTQILNEVLFVPKLSSMRYYSSWVLGLRGEKQDE